MEIADLATKIDAQEAKIDKMVHDLHRIKQFFLWSLIGTLVTFVLPLIIAVVAIPIFMGKYMASFEGLL